jgi:hypothetical protein
MPRTLARYRTGTAARHLRRATVNLILLFLGLAAGASAQVASSTLIGEVRDQSSALAPSVKVTARHEGTGFSRTVLTGSAGTYRIDELIPGTYTVTAEKSGFRTLSAAGIMLEVNQKAKLDLILELGAEHDVVNVSASVSPVETADATVGYRLDLSFIRALPLAERNVISLVTLGPGAIPRQLGGFVHDVVNDIQEGPRGAVALNPPINGARSTMNAYTFDGANDTDRNTFAIAVNPPMESVHEFRIQSSLPSAEFAQAGGGVVDVVSRSGASEWHGSAFEYFRNEALDAHNYFDDPSLPRPIFRENQFGGSIGGRLPVPSTFFFATYEGLRGKNAAPSVALVPDQALRSGDFAASNPIFDPLNSRRPFPNNVIPADRIDPIARKFLDAYEPLPNTGAAAGNYVDATPTTRSDDSVSGRIDHQFRNQSRLFGRYTLNEQRDRVASRYPLLPTSERLRAQQAALAYTSGGAAWLNEARASFTRLRLFDVPANAFQNNVAQSLGIDNPPTDPFTYGLPYFLVTNYSLTTDSPTLPQVQRDNSWNLSDGVSLERGHHTWKFGADFLRSEVNYLRTENVRGQYQFTGAFTANPASQAATGDPFADFLLGLPQITTRDVGSTQAYLRQNRYAAYLAHDWRVTSRLTLNLGARYEYAAPFTEARGNLLNLDYSHLPAAPSLVRVSQATNPDRNDIAPRVGLAYVLPGNTVFRAGYGVYFSPEIATEIYDLVLNGIRIERNETNGNAVPILTTANGFPTTASTGFPTYYGIDPNAATPYVQQWSASFERELPGQILFEAAYVGTKGTKLGRFRDFNTPAHVETGQNLPPRPGGLQSLRTFPELGTIYQRQHIANSIYHSLQLKANKRFARNLAFLASFVWSKSIDDADSVIPGQFDSFGAQDERNLRLERGLSFFNVGRRVSAGFAYDLPNRTWLRPVLANWSLSGIVTLQDGTPLNPVYFAFDPANSGTPNRPNIVPGQSIAIPRSLRTIERFFNTNAFQAPAPYTFGNAGRDIIPGPGNNVFDLSLHRRFPLGEQRVIEFRAESFNTFNHPNWGVPGPYPDFGPFFGRIFVTGEPRRMQLALRFDF